MIGIQVWLVPICVQQEDGGILPFCFMSGPEPYGQCPLRFLAQDWRAESWALSSEGAAVLLGNENISRPEQDLVPSGLARAQAGDTDT